MADGDRREGVVPVGGEEKVVVRRSIPLRRRIGGFCPLPDRFKALEEFEAEDGDAASARDQGDGADQSRVEEVAAGGGCIRFKALEEFEALEEYEAEEVAAGGGWVDVMDEDVVADSVAEEVVANLGGGEERVADLGYGEEVMERISGVTRHKGKEIQGFTAARLALLYVMCSKLPVLNKPLARNVLNSFKSRPLRIWGGVCPRPSLTAAGLAIPVRRRLPMSLVHAPALSKDRFNLGGGEELVLNNSFNPGFLVGEDESEAEDADGDVAVCARDEIEDADQFKNKIAEEEIRGMEKLQLIPYPCNPPKYQYSKEYDTELTRADKEKLKEEEVAFNAYYQYVQSWCRASFELRTALSSMHFAHYTPRQIPFSIVTTQASLQIFSFKIVSCEFSWPLYVYGVVAVRDHVDDHRNILFERSRSNAQLITRDDPSLGLFGPSRGICAVNPVEFEVELKLKCRTESRDIPLVKKRGHHSCSYTGFGTIDFSNCLCKAELSLEQLGNSVQATFLSVCVVEGGPCTFRYGGRVYCSSLDHEVMVTDSQGYVKIVDPPSSQVVLIDSRDCAGGKLPTDRTGLLDLARCVVSVPIDKWNDYSPQYDESLKVVIQAYSLSGDVAAQAHVKLRPKLSNTSRVKCVIGNSKVEIIIAWSVMLKSKDYLL